MNFSLTTSTLLVPDDLRAEYKRLIEDEVAASDPAKGAKLMKEDMPEQLEFSFSKAKG